MYNIAKLDDFLEGLFKVKGYPSVAVSLRGPEGVIFEKGYGFGDMKKTLKVNSDTIYGVASMSKSMTTLACAILESEGKLSFSDPVVKYFPNFSVPGIPTECITLRHLAMHTAGIPPIPPLEWSIVMNTEMKDSEYTRTLRESSPNKMGTIEDIIAYIAKGESYTPLGAPGEYMSYSNEGYALLSYVVDQAAGVTLEAFLEERIFKPLEMTRTVLDLDGKEAIKIAGGNIVELFGIDDEGKLYSDNAWSILPPYRGCACVKSTASDMTKYYQALSQNGFYNGKQVIPANAVEILVGRAFPETSTPYYCLGLNKRLMKGEVICEHAGGLHGVSTNGGFIKGGFAMTALCNQGEVSAEPFIWAFYNTILDLPLETPHYYATPSQNRFSAPEKLLGMYISQEGIPSQCTISLNQNGDLVATHNKEELMLHYCEETLFSARTPSDPEAQKSVMRFLLRDGKAWGVKINSRIYQRQG